MDEIWDVPRRERGSVIPRVFRASIVLVALGLTVTAAALAAGAATSLGPFAASAGLIIAVLLNVATMLIVFRVLTVADVSWRDVLPGAVLAGASWTVLQTLGGYFLERKITGASNVYGTFAVVIGLLWWLFIGAQLTVVAAEVNVVLRRRLGPGRSSRLPPSPPMSERSPSRRDRRNRWPPSAFPWSSMRRASPVPKSHAPPDPSVDRRYPRSVRLWLLRHAKSSWDDDTLADIDRPLAPRGVRAASAMATYIATASIRPGLVLCSPAVRARETLEHVLPSLGDPEVRIEPELYTFDPQSLLLRLRSIPAATTSVMVVGHDPAIHDVAVTLAGTGERLADLTAKYPTGALAELELDGDSWGSAVQRGTAVLARFVRPRDL